MTIGIYALIFNNTNKVYIGQSKDLESREIRHRYSISHGLSSKKLCEAYNLYGAPTFKVLCYCSTEELDDLEEEAISIFNAVDNGFNSFKQPGGGNNTTGEDHHNSKYSNEDIIEVFNLLTDDVAYTFKQISTKLNVSYSIVCDIAKGATHRWLENVFPDKYIKLREKMGNRKSISVTDPDRLNTVISPDNVIFKVYNIRAFCREHNLYQSHLGKVLKGTAKSHKGWKLYEENTSLISPQ